MGKKYIIELENKPFHKEDGDFLYRVKGFKSLVFDMTGIGKLTPYTEPDLDRTKKTAYDDGYNTGYQAGREDLNRVMSDIEQVRKEAYEAGAKSSAVVIADDKAHEAYQRGYDTALDDLWEAMQKAIKMYCEIDNEVFLRVFHDVKCDWGESVLQALFKNTPQHLIDSIRKYEENKKKHTWICSEVNEPSVDTTLICSECGYTMKLRIGDTTALSFCPKCGDCKKPKEEES